MSFERRERHIMRELNLVPLIDVLLVVLFFYMIISPMMSRGLDVNLPKSEANTVKPEDRIVLTVTRGAGSCSSKRSAWTSPSSRTCSIPSGSPSR